MPEELRPQPERQAEAVALSLWTRNDPTVQALIRYGHPLTKRAYAQMEWHMAYEELGPELRALIPSDLPEASEH